LHKPIGFKDGQEKAQWRGGDLAKFQCFSYFFNGEGLQWGRRIRIGNFTTKIKAWVGDADWDQHPFHYWLAYCEKLEEGGFLLIIWDSNKACFDGLSVVNIRQLLWAQKQFIEYCARDRQIEECWIWGNGEGNPDNKRLRLTSNFLRPFLSEECWKNWRPALTNLPRLGAIRIGLTQAAADWDPRIPR
jgi:hypothetical protein